MADADMLHHAHRDNPVELASQLAVVDLAELDQVADARLGGALPGWICSGETLMATTLAPVVRAMWMANEPQPEPISATTMPGSSRSLAVAWTSLLNWAVSRLSEGSRK